MIWDLEFGIFRFGIYEIVVTPTKEVSRFIEFLSRDSSLHFLRQRRPLSVQALGRNDILGHEFGI
jgi:hypothetical protein